MSGGTGRPRSSCRLLGHRLESGRRPPLPTALGPQYTGRGPRSHTSRSRGAARPVLCPRLGSFPPLSCSSPRQQPPLRSPIRRTSASRPSPLGLLVTVALRQIQNCFRFVAAETEAPWLGRVTLGRQDLCARHPGNGLCPQHVPESWHRGEEFTRSLSRQLGS